jgi:hypothetical protein
MIALAYVNLFAAGALIEAMYDSKRISLVEKIPGILTVLVNFGIAIDVLFGYGILNSL